MKPIMLVVVYVLLSLFCYSIISFNAKYTACFHSVGAIIDFTRSQEVVASNYCSHGQFESGYSSSIMKVVQ